MPKMITILSLLLIALFGCQAADNDVGHTDNTHKDTVQTDPISTPTQLNDGINSEDELTDLNNLFFQQSADGFQMIQTSDYPTQQLEDEVINEANSFRAFSFCDFHCSVYVEEVDTGQVYELKAPSFIPGRFFFDLIWTEDNILELDQSSQPHQATHYTIDVKNQRLLEAYPYPLP